MATARWEACELYLQQEIDRVLEKEGKPGPESRELSKYISIIFEVDIPARTIEQKIRRRHATLVAQGGGQDEPQKPTLTPLQAAQAFKTKMLERFKSGSSYETLTTELDQKITGLRDRIGEMTNCLGELTATREEIDRLEAMKPLSKKNMRLLAHALTEDYDLLHFNGDWVNAQQENFGVMCKSNIGLTASIRGIEFLQFMQKKTGHEVTFNDTEKTLLMQGGGIKLDSKKFPNKAKPSPDFSQLTFVDVPEDFLDALKVCLPSVDRRTDIILGGLHIADNKILGCDNVTVTEYTMEKGFGQTFTLPKKSARFLLDYKPVGFCLHDGKAVFTDGNTYVWSKIKREEYPAKKMIDLLDKEGEEFTLPEEAGKYAKDCKPFEGNACHHIGVSIGEKEVILSGVHPMEITLEHVSEKQTKFDIPPKKLAHGLSINTKFTHCGDFLIFKNGNTRHMACLISFAPQGKEEPKKKAKAQAKPKTKKEKLKKAAA